MYLGIGFFVHKSYTFILKKQKSAYIFSRIKVVYKLYSFKEGIMEI